MKKKRILVLVETSRIYGRQIIEGITRYALEHGNWIIFLEDRGLEKKIPRLVQCHYDGIISRTVFAESRLTTLQVPVVELLGDGVFRSSDILCDGNRLGVMASDYFQSKGLRHFGYFSTGQSWWSTQFYSAYSEHLATNGFSCLTNPFCRRKNDASLSLKVTDKTESRILHWLRAIPKPIGLFCPSDSQAVYLINLCQIAEIAVPHEIAILGVENNITLCNATSPTLSSIAVDGHQTGYQAAWLLDRKINKQVLPKIPILIPPIDVVARVSTDFITVADPDVAKALYFISQQVLLHITVQDIADAVDLSPRTLIRKFHESLGHTPEQELHRIRIERAKAILRNTNLSITKIGEQIGFTSTEYFVRNFRHTVKMTPKQYRLKFQNEENNQ
ncbi:MAG: substrate-binding domain-containing protein [Planctomycetaceae bacterium]|jgi:LacI family transcriptional regulator|nr:substrate-binding domain-containing protein [Planctomycetaceae bacterium]